MQCIHYIQRRFQSNNNNKYVDNVNMHSDNEILSAVSTESIRAMKISRLIDVFLLRSFGLILLYSPISKSMKRVISSHSDAANSVID